MRNINKYANIAEYNSDSYRPIGENTVSLIKNTDSILRNSINLIVERNFSDIGDTVIFDSEDNRIKVVKLGTLKRATLASRYIIVGTVYHRDEKQGYVVANADSSASEQYGAPFKVRLNGFTKPGSFTLKMNAINSAVINYVSGDTIQTLADKVEVAILGFGSGWTAKAVGNYVVVQQNFYTPVVNTFTSTDPTTQVTILTGNYQTDLTGFLRAEPSIWRRDGSNSYYAGGSIEKFTSYYSTNGGEETNQIVGEGNPIKRSFFTLASNPLLVKHYGAYENYMLDKMTKLSYSKGAIVLDNGKIETGLLSAVSYNDEVGTPQPGYPAARSAKTFSVPGFTNEWWLGSVKEMARLFENLKADRSDPVNKGIADGGGTFLNPADRYWTSSERTSYRAWYYNGSLGTMTSTNKTYSSRVRPLTAFQIK